MISTNIKVSQSLLKKLDKSTIEECARDIVDKTAVDTLEKVQEFGLGTAGRQKPVGGAPHWQGEIEVPGHYRGYLSEHHHIKHVDDYNKQIVSDADFVWGVIYGYSTNWFEDLGGIYEPITFDPNPYHKRAVDTLIAEGGIQSRWHGVTKGRLR